MPSLSDAYRCHMQNKVCKLESCALQCIRGYALFCPAFHKPLIVRRRCRFSGRSKAASNLFLSQTQNTATKKAKTVLVTTIKVRRGDDFLSGGTAASTT